jgi:hypothetical protein
MAGDLWVDDFGAQCLEPAEHALLVGFDQARIARHIGREDRREPTFDASFPCRLHSASSMAADPTRTAARRALSIRSRGSARHLSIQIRAYAARQAGMLSPGAVWKPSPDPRDSSGTGPFPLPSPCSTMRTALASDF